MERYWTRRKPKSPHNRSKPCPTRGRQIGFPFFFLLGRLMEESQKTRQDKQPTLLHYTPPPDPIDDYCCVAQSSKPSSKKRHKPLQVGEPADRRMGMGASRSGRADWRKGKEKRERTLNEWAHSSWRARGLDPPPSSFHPLASIETGTGTGGTTK